MTSTTTTNNDQINTTSCNFMNKDMEEMEAFFVKIKTKAKKKGTDCSKAFLWAYKGTAHGLGTDAFNVANDYLFDIIVDNHKIDRVGSKRRAAAVRGGRPAHSGPYLLNGDVIACASLLRRRSAALRFRARSRTRHAGVPAADVCLLRGRPWSTHTSTQPAHACVRLAEKDHC